VPSPVGHTLAGFCGYAVAQNYVGPERRGWLLVGSVTLANLADLDFLPGILLGDLRIFHHQMTHSLAAVVMVGLFIGGLAHWRKAKGIWWGMLGGSLYLSHIALDLLVKDSTPPFGVQLLWPFSKAYFISPITPFAGFNYFDPSLGVVRVVFSVHNLWTLLQEILLLAPVVWLSWYVGKKCASR